MNFRSVLEETELSQEKLGKTLGLSQKVISDWLLCRSMPNVGSLLLLNKVLGITPNEALGVDEYW